MRTPILPTVPASVATRCQYQWGCPKVNKFEQVSSDGHQMSLAGCPISHVWEGWVQDQEDPVQSGPMHHG